MIECLIIGATFGVTMLLTSLISCWSDPDESEKRPMTKIGNDEFQDLEETEVIMENAILNGYNEKMKGDRLHIIDVYGDRRDCNVYQDIGNALARRLSLLNQHVVVVSGPEVSYFTEKHHVIDTTTFFYLRRRWNVTAV
ncbi:hypothetical protein PFISCL1PPCAC_27376, partial [Pristionchus fissidentatus]